MVISVALPLRGIHLTKPTLIGEQVKLIGTIIEQLKYASNEWFVLELEDGTKITINKKYCLLLTKT